VSFINCYLETQQLSSTKLFYEAFFQLKDMTFAGESHLNIETADAKTEINFDCKLYKIYQQPTNTL
jgi:hypothetical protein